MEKNYTFNMFWEDLDNGFQIFYKVKDCKYLIYKLAKNCYKNELIEAPEKCPHQKNAVLTLKRVKEIFEDIEEIRYKFEV